jgi:hypothetical protein
MTRVKSPKTCLQIVVDVCSNNSVQKYVYGDFSETETILGYAICAFQEF